MCLPAAARRRPAAGERALSRSDNVAAANLLERAAALIPDEIDVGLEYDLGFALLWSGATGEALRRADSIAERAAAVGDRVGELCGSILKGRLDYYLEPQGATERLG